MKYLSYIYKLLAILVLSFCLASQFIVAQELTQQERTHIADFTSSITTFQIRTTLRADGSNIAKPILPNVPSNVVAAIEKAINCKDKEALANITALVLKFAQFANSPLFSEKIILDWNNPLTKAYYRIKKLLYGEIVNTPENAKITSDNILYTQYKIFKWLGEHSQLETVLQPKLEADRIRHHMKAQEVLTRRMIEYPCSQTYTITQAKQIIKDYVTNSSFPIDEDWLGVIETEDTPPPNVLKALWIMSNTNDKDYLAYIAYYYIRFYIKFCEDYPDTYVGCHYSKQTDIMVRIFVKEFPEIAEGMGPAYFCGLPNWVRKHRDKLGAFNLLDEAITNLNTISPIE